MTDLRTALTDFIAERRARVGPDCCEVHAAAHHATREVLDELDGLLVASDEVSRVKVLEAAVRELLVADDWAQGHGHNEVYDGYAMGRAVAKVRKDLGLR